MAAPEMSYLLLETSYLLLRSQNFRCCTRLSLNSRATKSGYRALTFRRCTRKAKEVLGFTSIAPGLMLGGTPLRPRQRVSRERESPLWAQVSRVCCGIAPQDVVSDDQLEAIQHRSGSR